MDNDFKEGGMGDYRFALIPHRLAAGDFLLGNLVSRRELLHLSPHRVHPAAVLRP